MHTRVSRIMGGMSGSVASRSSSEPPPFPAGAGIPPANFLTNLVGIAAGSLNCLPVQSAYATFTDFTNPGYQPPPSGSPNTGYTFTRSSLSLGVTGPDGSTNAQKLIEDNSTNTHFVFADNTLYGTNPTNIPLRFAVIAQAAQRTRIVVQFIGANTDPINSEVSIGLDLTGGNVGYDNVVGSHETLLATATTNLGGGWWLGTFDFVYSGTETLWAAKIFIDAGSGTAARNISYAGNGVNGVNLFWFNLMPLAAWSLTNLGFSDDFSSLSTIDLGNTQLPGYKWYLNGPSPSSVPQAFWNFTSPFNYPTANPANFSIASPSVLKLHNPLSNQTGYGTILDTIRADSSNGYVGTAFQRPMMVDCSVSIDNTGSSTADTVWHPSVESRTNNGLNPTFEFKEFNNFEVGGFSFAIAEGATWFNSSNHELPGAFAAGNAGAAITAVFPVFHRITSIFLTIAANGHNTGCAFGFADGQLGGPEKTFSVNSYTPTTRNVSTGAAPFTAPGSLSQLEWHYGSVQIATGEQNQAFPGGGPTMYVDWVRVFNNPSPPLARPGWNYLDQPLTLSGSDYTGALAFSDTAGLAITKTSADAAWDMIRCGMGKGAGQWYWEETLSGTIATTTSVTIGITNQLPAVIASGAFPGSAASGAGIRHGSNFNALVNGVTPNFSGTVTLAANDVWGFALDADNGWLFAHRNGTYINGPPSGGAANAVWTGLTTASPGINAAGWYPAVAIHDTGCTVTANFGQSAFAFSVPAGYNSGLF